MSKYKNIASEMSRFIVVGVTSVAIDAVVYFALIQLGLMSPENAKRISFVAGACFAFFANRRFTFRVKEKNTRQPIVFAILYLISFAANSVSHDIVLAYTNISMIAFLFATAVSTIINYLGQKFYVFRQTST